MSPNKGLNVKMRSRDAPGKGGSAGEQACRCVGGKPHKEFSSKSIRTYPLTEIRASVTKGVMKNIKGRAKGSALARVLRRGSAAEVDPQSKPGAPAAELRVSSPGRMCLFGEHQDYFGLAIIAGAVDLRIAFSGSRRDDKIFAIDLPDIGEKETFSFAGEIPYEKKRDYLKSAVNIHRRAGLPMTGWDCEVRGTIPINAGTSSSSAMVVAWNKFLLEAAGDARANDPRELAELGFLTEVAEFKEPGGKMDHYASALGGIVWIRFDDPMKLDQLENPLGTFVLANSLQKKDTTGTLGFIKSHVLEGAALVARRIPGFHLKSPLTTGVLGEIERLLGIERKA